MLVALDDVGDSVRAAAIYTLGKIGKDVPVSLLKKGLSDPCPLVREATATALGNLANTEARLILLTAIQEEEETLVREAIAQSLLCLETPLTQDFIQIIINMEYPKAEGVAQQAMKALLHLGLDIHEETACIAHLVVALQGINKDIQKAITTYLIGKAFDALSEKMDLAPSIELLQQKQLNPAEREGVWRVLDALAENTRQERKKIQLLISGLKDPDVKIRNEAEEAIRWLTQIANNLREERISIDLPEKALENKDEEQGLMINHTLIGQGLEALEERETLEPIFTGLRDADVQKKDAFSHLHKQAKKAFMARMPGGTLNISLRNTPGSTPLELQFGSTDEKEQQDGRTILPWDNTAPKAKEFIESPGIVKPNPINKNASNWT